MHVKTYCNQGTVYKAEYWFWCIGNNGSIIGILEFVPSAPYKWSQQDKHSMQACQDQLNQYEAEGEYFLYHIITDDKMQCL